MNIAIILAGGTGTRLGADIPKQYIQVNDKMILTYVLSTCVQAPEIDGIRIVCADMWEDDIEADIRKHLTASTWKEIFIGYSEPGDNRQLSILHALEDIEEDIRTGRIVSEDVNVMICDAARPLEFRRTRKGGLLGKIRSDGSMTVHYWLVRSANIPRDTDALPASETVRADAEKSISTYLNKR